MRTACAPTLAASAAAAAATATPSSPSPPRPAAARWASCASRARDLAPLIAGRCAAARWRRAQATLLPFLGRRRPAASTSGLALHFPAPHSYTGEDVLELQAHGGPVRAAAAAGALPARRRRRRCGLRLAEPGEFTERAFLNDKLDLAQAEAVADLIDASTEAAARSAGRSLGGRVLARGRTRWRERIVRAAHAGRGDARLPRGGDRLPASSADARGQLERHRRRAGRGARRARARARCCAKACSVVLAGQPNVGKSSLLNALAGAELAIVTPIPGTTRDRVSETIQIEGVPLHVIDTAGLRDDADADEVERIGIARSWEAIDDGRRGALPARPDARAASRPTRPPTRAIAARLPRAACRVLHVLQQGRCACRAPALPAGGASRCRPRTGAGLRRAAPARCCSCAGWQAAPEGLFIARARHVQALQRARRAPATQAQAHAARARRRRWTCWPRNCAWRSDALGEITGRVQRGRTARRDLCAFLHRQVSRRLPVRRQIATTVRVESSASTWIGFPAPRAGLQGRIQDSGVPMPTITDRIDQVTKIPARLHAGTAAGAA
ncbi:MAG: 50S ribosome-binding GTPase [Comamonadaceae bacterium]|nr:50S ribosome-binding GTPase [Comamonadaceae bacterium]